MSDPATRIVQKLWSHCQVPRDDGLSSQGYLEQLTFLLFLKMADERARLCVMNLFLHGIGPDGDHQHEVPICTDEALRDEPAGRAAVVVLDDVLLEGGAGEIVCRNRSGNARGTSCCACPPASSTPRA